MKAIDGLRGIISRGDYGLVFQPILDAHSGDIHHYEALARFPALRGTTGEHIMLAEEIGLISEFDFGMLCKVFESARRAHRRRQGKDRRQHLRPVGELRRLYREPRSPARREPMAAGPADVRDHRIQPDG